MKHLSIIILFFSVFFISCDEIMTPDVHFAGQVQATDSLQKTFDFTFNGIMPDLLAIYPGDPGHNFRYSSLWLNSEEFKKQFDNNNNIAGVCVYQFEAPLGGTYDTLNIKTFEEEGIDAFYIQIYSPYSKKTYHRKLSESTFDQLTMDTIIVYAGSENNGTENKLKKFDEGVNIITKYKAVTYKYTYAGQFEAYAVATNISDKQYYGDGYITKRFSTIDEYGMLRQVTSIDVTVGIELQLELNVQFTNAFQIAIKIPVELKSKALNLTKEDFELRDAVTNKIVTITGIINQVKNLGWYGIQAKYVKGKKYKLRPVKSFYGNYIEVTIP